MTLPLFIEESTIMTVWYFLFTALANIIGAFFGFLLALRFDRRKSRAQSMEDNQKEKNVLGLLQYELYYNIQLMSNFHADVSNYYAPIDITAWNAVSQSGGLMTIRDEELQMNLAKGYAAIVHYASHYERYVDLYDVSDALNRTSPLRFKRIEELQSVALPLAKFALTSLEKRLGVLDSLIENTSSTKVNNMSITAKQIQHAIAREWLWLLSMV